MAKSKPLIMHQKGELSPQSVKRLGEQLDDAEAHLIGGGLTEFKYTFAKPEFNKEVQSDHHSRGTKGLNIMNWPEFIREAAHIDFRNAGLAYSVVPNASEIIGESVIGEDEQGLMRMIEDVYGKDNPPKGYKSWGELEPAERTALLPACANAAYHKPDKECWFKKL